MDFIFSIKNHYFEKGTPWVEIDGTMCFVVSCGCEFCEQWRMLNE